MRRFITIILVLAFLSIAVWGVLRYTTPQDNTITSHAILVESIESMGKLELVKYRISDVIEHKDVSAYLPDASVLLIVKADAVGCIDLTRISKEKISINGDSVSIQLPEPEICYIKIDHDASKVYDTKMAFFREAELVDQAYRNAEIEIKKEVTRSDILQQTRSNAIHVFKPLLEGLGFKHYDITFEGS